MRETEINNPEIPTPETVEIPGFGKVEIIPSINAHACVCPGESKDLTSEGAEKSFTSIGYTMALYGAGPEIAIKQLDGPVTEKITPQQAVKIVTAWETSEGREPAYHRSIRHEGRGIGCAQVDQASKKVYEELYGIPSEEVIEMRNYILDNNRIVPEISVLPDPDKIRGVLAVLTNIKDPKTVKSTDDEGNKFIRIDMTMHYKNLYSLANYAKVNPEPLITNADMQMKATLGLSAGNLALYVVDLRGKSPKVTEKGFIKPIPQRA